MNTQIVPGSISALAQQSGKSIAESFVSCDVIVIVDTSGSMATKDSHGGQSRYDVACQELAALQQSLPGKIAVIGFSDNAQFHPGGIPIYQGGCTDMAGALAFVQIADQIPGMRFILISDGEPDDGQRTLTAARTFKNKIDVIFVGPENRPIGRDFLERLAAVTGGQSITADRAKELKSGIEKLYLSA